ncbi:hypothetical protein Tco_0576329 [Tanacetum coccineum]
MFETPLCDAITTPSIEKPEDSLIMEDEDIDTIPEKESDEEIESGVENLFHIPSESEVTSDNESECDLPIFDDFYPLDIFEDNYVIFSRPLFDFYGDTSSDEESFLEEDDTEKKFPDLPLSDTDSISNDMNPIYDEELEDIKCTNSLTDSSPKIDSLLEEFAGELALIDPIPTGIENSDFDTEEEIRLIEKLLYDNSTPRPPKESNFEISDATIKSYSPSHIPVEDSDSLMEEINLFLDPDDSIPPGIESDDYDSEGDVLFLEELLNDDYISPPAYKSFHVDLYNVPSSGRPSEKPLDNDIHTYQDFKNSYYDSEGDIIYLESFLIKDTIPNLSPKVFFDHEPQCFKDEPKPDTLKSMVKVFDLGILVKFFSPSYVRLSSKDHHYLSFIIVTYLVNFLFSFGSEDNLFDLGIFAYIFYSYKPLESLFGHLFDEYFNEENQVVSKSSAVTTADASDKRQQQPDSTSSTSTLATTVTADGNFDL